MRYFCTYFDSNYLTRGLALHRSLVAHAGDFELVVLCLDAEVESALRKKALPRLRLVPIAELVSRYSRLADAQNDRSRLEFYFTCAPWLMRHLLPSIPPGEFLTHLDADLYFYSSPEPIYAQIASASIAVTPHRFPISLYHMERYGKFNVGWVSLRHDATGLACAADWAEKCVDWCFNQRETTRYANQGYADAWHAQFPDTVSITHPGVNVAPWNIKDGSITKKGAGIYLNDEPLIFYHFHALTHLGEQIYDPYLDRYDAVLTPGLREHVYWPYLRLLHADSPPAAGLSDVIPPSEPDDPRNERIILHLLGRLQTSEVDRAKRLEAVETSNAATEQTVQYLRRVEKDSEERLNSIHFYQEKLQAAYADLERNVTYLKLLESEIAAHVKVSADKDAIIADLAHQLQVAAQRAPVAP